MSQDHTKDINQPTCKHNLQPQFVQIDDKDINNYNKYVDAIIRNANDIHSIVNEFIQFARIPKPKNEIVIIKSALFIVYFFNRTVNFTSVNYHSDCFSAERFIKDLWDGIKSNLISYLTI